ASVPEVKKARGDVPDIFPEPESEPTSQTLAGLDQAIHKLSVGHYTLDVKVSQLMDRLSKMDAENHQEPPQILTQMDDKPNASVPEVKKARGDVPDIFPESEPTSQTSDFENSYNYVLSRLAGLDQAIHKLSVGHYTLDVK
ncbi:unnamed protein product, partial [Menidia menidia]